MRSFSQVICALLLVCLTACGGGGGGGSTGGSAGGGGGGGGGGSPPPPPPTPTVTPLSTNEAARLLEQASFGVSDASLAAAQTSDAAGWVTDQLSQPQFATTMLSYVDARLVQMKATNTGTKLLPNQFYEGFYQRAVTASDQLRQRMRFALSQIFVISLADPVIEDDIRGAASYYDMLGANAFGNYRTLLEAVTLHPMMGIYLTYIGNQKEDPAVGRTPDENYAREIMQLMSIGLYMMNIDGTPKLDGAGQPIPTYTQEDVAGLAKVFTGISWFSPTPSNTTFAGGSRNANADVTPMIFYSSFHSTSEKKFLGVTIPASSTADIAGDLKIALDTIANHPNVGPFMAIRLIQQFVTSNPSPAYVQRVATVFNNNGQGVRGDLAAVIRAVILDPEARDMSVVSSPTFGKIREPVIRLTNWMRAFAATTQSGNWMMVPMSANTQLSQSPLASPSVFNFWRPGYVPPNTQMGSRNLVVPELQVVDEVSVAGYLNTIQDAINNGIGQSNDIRSSFSNETAIANDASALADRLNKLLFYGQMSATLKQRIVEGVNAVNIPTTGDTGSALLNRARIAVFLALASPEFLVLR